MFKLFKSAVLSGFMLSAVPAMGADPLGDLLSDLGRAEQTNDEIPEFLAPGCPNRFEYVSISQFLSKSDDPSLLPLDATEPVIYDEDMTEGWVNLRPIYSAAAVWVAIFKYPDCSPFPRDVLLDVGLNRVELGAMLEEKESGHVTIDPRYSHLPLRGIFDELNGKICVEGEAEFVEQQRRLFVPRSYGACPTAG